jgi:putative ABC transport system permease protein
MNIIHKLTIRHLKENKRRTLVTIIGVIISVAMITAVATLGVSFLDLMKRQTIAKDGEWHVEYENVDKKQLAAIKADSQTKEMAIANNVGYAMLEGSQNQNKPYLFIKQFNQIGFENFPIQVTEGRLPNSPEEVVVSEEIPSNAKVDYKIGDHLTLEIGQRKGNDPQPLSQNYSLQKENGEVTETLTVETKKTYTIVGFIERPLWEPTWSPGYSIISYTDSDLMTEGDRVDAIVVVHKINKELFEYARSLSNQHQIEKVNFNSELLRYYGVTDNDNLRSTLFSLVAIIMVVIIVGSVALIYNAFAISVSERARHLGMLASVGATKKQKRNSVFFEGFIIGVISIPIGVIAGLAGIAITFSFINPIFAGALGTTEKLSVIVTLNSILVSCMVSVTTIFISTFTPARKASRVSAIDAIRQTQDIKLARKTVKTTKLIRRLFGIEAEIGLKNLKRNNKRYKATVFSLVISIVLFLSVSFFTTNLKKSLELSQDGISYDINGYLGNGFDQEKVSTIADLKEVTDFTISKKLSVNAWIDKENLPNELLESNEDLIKDGKYPYYITLHALDDVSFKEYVNQINAEMETFINAPNPTAIVISEVKYQDYDKGKLIETESIHAKPGDKLELFYTNEQDGSEVLINEVEIGYLTKQLPIGEYRAAIGGLDVIVTEKTLNEMLSKHPLNNNLQVNLFVKTTDPMKTQTNIEDLNMNDIQIYNVYQRKQEEEQLILFMSVFTYGFIVLITLISIANIFNTISTSISLRKREFAMLRSVGMTPKGFNKMIRFESIFYGFHALLYGLPFSAVVMGLIFWSMRRTFEYGFTVPWLSLVFVVVTIFIVVAAAMLYSINKVKKENIIDALKQENI